jgi:SAM-dependent methyltransferase
MRKNKFYSNALPYYVRDGKVLEIGCSHGKFLYEMKILGWDVKGIDMSPEAVSKGRNFFGLDLIQGDIDRVNFKENSFDVIVMRMALEHMYSPASVLTKVNKWLRPNGYLVVIVPDISGFEARLFGKYFYGLHLPNHLFHFSLKTLSAYLIKHGITICKICHHRSDRDFSKSIENLLHDIRFLSVLKSSKRIFLNTVTKFLMGFMGVIARTSRMTVYARKRATDS